MIRIGQAGIPLSCKGRTNKDGIVYTKQILDLNAMEIQFVRGLYVMEDDEAQFIHDYAKENDVELHVHAPYYINLAGSGEELDLSLEKIIYSARVGDKMDAKTVVIHPGFYGEESEKKTMKKMVKSIKKIQGAFKKDKLKIKLGIETMGKQRVFGSLDEIIEVCRQVKGVIPVIGLGHIHARTNGGLKKREDFEEVFAKLKPLRLRHFLLHVTGVMYENGNEYYHVPIKKGDMPLAPLIEIILDNNMNVTFIS
ncbi:MAG: TIM barrel protein, partial [Candidatus Thorarchaeota archaeon]